mgnify:CR=1 FL=1
MIRKIVPCLIGLTLSVQTFAADPGSHRSYLAVSYGDGSGEYTSSGTKVDMEFDGYTLGGLFYIDAGFDGVAPILAVQRSDISGKIGTTSFDSETSTFALGAAFGGVNYTDGKGKEFQVLLDRDDESSSDASVNAIFGLGGGLTANLGYYSNISDDIMDSMSGYKVGLDISVTDNMTIGTEYWNEDGDYKDGDKIEGSTWALGIKYFIN